MSLISEKDADFLLKQDSAAKFLGELGDHYFSPYSNEGIEFAQFASLIARASTLGVDIRSNFDLKAVAEGTETDRGIPENFGLKIGPIRKRSENKQGMIQLGLYAYCVPTPEFIMSLDTPEGVEFKNAAILGSYQTKIRLSTTPNKDGDIPLEPPYSLDEWIKRAERGEGLKTFNEDAPEWVKFLKKQGLKTMTTQLLRLCLQSQAYAESIFKRVIKPEEWDKLLQAMAAKATRDGRNPAIYQNWLETRHNVSAADAQFNSAALDEMLAALNAPETADEGEEGAEEGETAETVAKGTETVAGAATA